MRSLEDENERLKQIRADLTQGKRILAEALHEPHARATERIKRPRP
jgi:hypothetical protein